MSTTSCIKETFIKENIHDGEDYLPIMINGVGNTITMGQIVKAITEKVATNWAKKVFPAGKVADFISDFSTANGFGGAVASFMHKIVHNEEITSADWGRLAHAALDTGLHMAQLITGRTPFGVGLSLFTSLVEVLSPYVPCIWKDDQPDIKPPQEVKSPLAIDLDGDGIATYALKNGVFFDIDSDGFAEKTAWLNGKDAFLAIDRNKNGVIDDASELFGDSEQYANGFEALKALDTNNDGVIDANDAGWEDLMLWIDAINDEFFIPANYFQAA